MLQRLLNRMDTSGAIVDEESVMTRSSDHSHFDNPVDTLTAIGHVSQLT